jgi:hypothetical protein
MDTNNLVCSLSVTERDELRQLLNKRMEKVSARTADCFAFKDLETIPFLVNGAPYWGFGYDPETFPLGLFDDPAVMTIAQERAYYGQVKEIDDDFVPYLMPWLGTGVLASGFGCQIEYPPKQDPVVSPRHYPVKSTRDIKELLIPDPEKDGLMPKVLAYLRYMKLHSFLPVGITDIQGPLTTANQLMGFDNLIYLMQDEPTAAHELMDKITEALIQWIKQQKEIIGEPLTECISDQQVYTGRHAGVWFSDDDAVLISPKFYKEFVVPYNSRVCKVFGGGCLHFCGNATHQVDNFLHIDSLRAINNSLMHNIRSFRELKAKVEGRIVLFAVDLTPEDKEQHLKELFEAIPYKGMIVHWVSMGTVGMTRDGQWLPMRRDFRAGRRSAYDFLCRYLHR